MKASLCHGHSDAVKADERRLEQGGIPAKKTKSLFVTSTGIPPRPLSATAPNVLVGMTVKVWVWQTLAYTQTPAVPAGRLLTLASTLTSMNFLFLSPQSLPSIGGLQYVVHYWAEELVRRGHEVVAITDTLYHEASSVATSSEGDVAQKEAVGESANDDIDFKSGVYGLVAGSLLQINQLKQGHPSPLERCRG